MIINYRKIPIKQLLYVFKFNMPLNLVLEHKYGVCKDYAKLTACLLTNLYPHAKICFVKSSGHVATGIFVGKQLHMLDQHLPIKTINGWHKRNKSGKKEYILKGKSFQTEDIVIKTTNLDTERLKAELTKRLNISKKVREKETSDLVITWKEGVLYYEDDEFVNYSLARWLKNKISDEVLDLTQFSSFEIEPKGDDLEFKISFMAN